jgi:hypothetical protein
MVVSDLQIERQLEQFFAAQRWPGWRAAPRLELGIPPMTLHFESDGGQLRVTLLLPVAAVDRQEALRVLLGLCRPEAAGGAPLLAFPLGDQLALRCLWPPPGDLASWLELFRRQQALLERAARGRA